MRRLAAEYPEFPVHVVGGNLISRPMTLAEDVERQPGLVDFWHLVDTFATRIAGFDKNILASCKKLINTRSVHPSRGELLASKHQLCEVDYTWPKPEGAFEKVMAAGLCQKGEFVLALPYAITTLC